MGGPPRADRRVGLDHREHVSQRVRLQHDHGRPHGVGHAGGGQCRRHRPPCRCWACWWSSACWTRSPRTGSARRGSGARLGDRAGGGAHQDRPGPRRAPLEPRGSVSARRGGGPRWGSRHQLLRHAVLRHRATPMAAPGCCSAGSPMCTRACAIRGTGPKASTPRLPTRALAYDVQLANDLGFGAAQAHQDRAVALVPPLRRPAVQDQRGTGLDLRHRGLDGALAGHRWARGADVHPVPPQALSHRS